MIISAGKKLRSFFNQSVRVWHVLRKPSKDEFWAVAKVSAIGLLIIGALGFIVADALKIFQSLFQ